MSRVVFRMAVSSRDDVTRAVACMKSRLVDTSRSNVHISGLVTHDWVRAMHGKVRINQQGRIVIPAECRAAAGIKAGDDLVIETVREGELRVRTRRQALKDAQDLYARIIPKDRDLVAELIAERRAEAERE
jgi:AbrB family looped-hinge helix DNA binding protein